MPSATAQSEGADAAQLLANARDAFAAPDDCGDTTDSSIIVVCGDNGVRHRLTPEQRAIAGYQRTPNDPIPAPDPLSPAAMAAVDNRMMNVSRLPFNWMSMGGRFGRPPAPNAALEQIKRAEAAAADEAAAGAPPPP
jgi:hypothetical protein